MDDVTSLISTVAGIGLKIINSNVSIAFIGGCAGAFGGAFGAQRIVERKASREENIKELRATNTAIIFAHSICNTALSLKKDHLLPMHDNYEKLVEKMEAFNARVTSPEILPGEVLKIEMDMKGVTVPVVPIESLKTIVYHDISSPGRAIALVAEVEKALNNLIDVLKMRDDFISKFRNGEIPENQHMSLYFGLPFGDNQLSTELPDATKAAKIYIDDLAFFSSLLCNDLNEYGKKVIKNIKGKSVKPMFVVNEADFSNALESGLLPPISQYDHWKKGFIST